MLTLNYPMWVKQKVPSLAAFAVRQGNPALARPSELADGDLMVAVERCPSSTLIDPSGWSIRRRESNGTWAFSIYTKTAASEPSTWTFGGERVVLSAWRNATGVDVVGAAQYTPGGGLEIPAPSITATRAGILIGCYAATANSTSLTFSAMDGMTAIATTSSSDAAAYQQRVGRGPGATGIKKAELSSSSSVTAYGALIQIY